MDIEESSFPLTSCFQVTRFQYISDFGLDDI